MATTILKLDDLRTLNSPEAIANVFQRLGYNKVGCPLDINDLKLSARNAEAVYNAHLIADQDNGKLQVLLLQLQPSEWETPNTVSTRLKAIANQIGRRPTEFLLLATKDYNQLMLVNPYKTFDEQHNLKTGIRKLLIDRTNPTAYDRDRLEAIAAKNLTPEQLYQAQCEAFNVEKLTKQFYRGYKELFDRVQLVVKEYNQHIYFDDGDRLHHFSQRLLGRIMFLYFLQKKEFLAGKRNFLSYYYQPFRLNPDDPDYYSSVLEPLFFETLNAQRPNLESPWGKIPYLNGGLFDRDYGEGIKDAAGRETPKTITLPNTLFDPGSSNSILAFFNSYNFTVSENVANDEDIAIDPEMLGKVFENMLAAEERGQSGTFYTPRGIVKFMCSEVLTRYLADALTNSSTAIPPVNPEEKQAKCLYHRELVQKLINYDSDLPDSEFNSLITPQQAKDLKRAISSLKVLDPAVGSGAFPLGMMQVILQVRQAIARREGMTVQRGSLTISQWKREIIANNLYGVDIKPEAIEIAKLRMWLSLVVDIPNIEDVEPLPNLDYKLMCGDSLISTIHGENLITDSTKEQQLMLAVTPIQEAIQPLLELQRRYFDAQTQERHQLREQILKAEANVFKVAITDRRNYLARKLTELENKIKHLPKPTKLQLKKQQELTAKIAELEQFADQVVTGKRAFNFFQYHLHFRDVFESKGGFDVVIGNPPYVRQEAIKDLKPALQAEYECYTGVADLYVYFYEQGIKLLKNNGYLSYISSNKYFRAGYGEKLRKYLGLNSKVEVLIDFGDANVFEAIAYPSIILVKKSKPDDHQARVLNWEVGKSVDAFESVFKKESFYMPQKELGADGWRLESPAVLRLLDKLRSAGTPLGEYVDTEIYRGITTGFNEAFIVNKETRDKLISEHQSSAKILKPFLRGKDVKRWSINYQDLYIIYTDRGIDINEYPAIKNYLAQYKDRLTPGFKGGRATGNYEWFELQASPKNSLRFQSYKIIIPTIAQKTECYLDKDNYFCNDKTSICISKDNEYIIGILNSEVANCFFKNIAATKQGGFLEFKPVYISQVPIPKATEDEKQVIGKLVAYVIYLTQELKDIPNRGEKLRETAEDKLMLSYFEQILDALVMELYLPDELHRYDKYFMQHILTENLPSLDKLKGDKISQLRPIFKRLFDKDNPIAINIYFLKTLEVVRIIRGEQ